MGALIFSLLVLIDQFYFLSVRQSELGAASCQLHPIVLLAFGVAQNVPDS